MLSFCSTKTIMNGKATIMQRKRFPIAAGVMLTREQAEWLDAEGERRDASNSELIREALDEYRTARSEMLRETVDERRQESGMFAAVAGD